MEIHADQDILLKPDGSLIVTNGNGDHRLGGKEGFMSMIIPPSDWLMDDDTTSYNYAIVDNGGSAKVMTSTLEAYCMFRIPAGTHMNACTVYGSNSLETFAIYKSAVNSASVSAIDTSTSMNSAKTGMNEPCSALEYIIIRWNASSTSSRLYGAYIVLK
jgi:hypothetical protein